MVKEVVIVSAVRTAVGSFMGSLSGVKATDLGGIVIKEALARAGVKPNQVDEVIMGNVLQAGLGQNPARQAALAAELPIEVPSMTINKLCGSGLKSVHLATQAIIAGDAEIVVAGGMENMSRAPYILENARAGFKMGNQPLEDTLLHDGLNCAINGYHMGITAENLVDKYDLTREEQDQFSAWSQEKLKQRLILVALKLRLFLLKLKVEKVKSLYLHKMNSHVRVQLLKALENFVLHSKRMVRLQLGTLQA